MPRLIHLDQVGFMPTRKAKDNNVRVLNAIHLMQERGKPSLLVSSGAEKAFDRVELPFLEATLRHIGLGARMMRYILGGDNNQWQ